MPDMVHRPRSSRRKARILELPIERIKREIDAFIRDEEVDACMAMIAKENLNEFGYDPFGFNPEVVRRVLPFAKYLYRYYFRTEVFGADRIPPNGRLLVVANHSGQLPVDGMVLAVSLLLDTKPPRMVRGMVERFVPRLPWVNTLFTRCGQILGAPENCRRLLESNETVMVFPEGARGISKPPSHSYRLTEFGYGFLRLAIQTKSPILPVAIIGGEEQYIRVANLTALARIFKLPAVPLFLFGMLPIPGGLIPFPTRYRLHFGEPLYFEGDPDEDDAILGKKVKQVKSQIQHMLQYGLNQRKHIFW
jgi:1-acyl-sn-glycerol-3-phosphate acyltransferase